MEQNLIIDVGLNNGDDAAYYLHLGCRVVGIEANPLLAAQCTRRFESEINQGRMTVVNVGVLKEPGVFTFYRNLLNDGWSSFEPEKGRKPGEWEQIEISCVTTRQLIAEYGRPFFMKVDIEGCDLQTLESLTPTDCPSYVSLELNYTDPTVDKLVELGYSAFKFVDGDTFWPAPPIYDHEVGFRLLRKAGRLLPFIRHAVTSLPQRFRNRSEWNPAGKYSPDHYPFTAASSGPFGEQAAGPWMSSDQAVRWFSNLRNYYRKAQKEDSLWWDVHARHSHSNLTGDQAASLPG